MQTAPGFHEARKLRTEDLQPDRTQETDPLSVPSGAERIDHVLVEITSQPAAI